MLINISKAVAGGGGATSGPQTPRPIFLDPPFLIPGYGPLSVKNNKGKKRRCLKSSEAELCFMTNAHVTHVAAHDEFEELKHVDRGRY